MLPEGLGDLRVLPGGGQGVRSKLAKRMRAMCAELLSSPEARLWSQDA
jgi:hypothetical protein